MTDYRIASIPGDGIGKEVVPAARNVVDAAGEKFGFRCDWTSFNWGCERYAATGLMMPENGLEQLREHQAILLGAIGYPGVPDHLSLWGLLIPIRRTFEQYINLRPVRLLPGIRSPLADRQPEDIDFIVVRENNEGEYSEIGGRLYQGTSYEMAVQQAVFTRRGVDRVIRYAFELARSRPARHLTSATKSNGIMHSMPFWDERFHALSGEYPDVAVDQFQIDILSAQLVQHPDWFDVIVASNLFGDILSDIGPAIAGSIGMAPGANLNPAGEHPSMFEPVHGSAPDIAGKGVANPIGQTWTAAMMLDHLGEQEAARAIVGAIEAHVVEGTLLTQDLGGDATTDAVAKALVDRVRTDGSRESRT